MEDQKSRYKKLHQKSKVTRIFCRLDFRLILNNLNDLVKSTDIIPAIKVIKTDPDAIYIEIGNIDQELKGLGFWKMNCSLLTDEECVNNVTEMIPEWTAEGRRELFDHRSVFINVGL